MGWALIVALAVIVWLILALFSQRSYYRALLEEVEAYVGPDGFAASSLPQELADKIIEARGPYRGPERRIQREKTFEHRD